MATLTQEAYKIIRKYDPTAKVVAASTTVRLQSAYKKFFPAYMKELKKLKWPIDVVSVHLYPASTGTPADRVGYIKQVKADMKKAKVPASKPLWDTEINYGIAGPGSGNPDKNIEGPTAAAWVAQTYLDDVRLRRGPRLLVLLVPQREPRRASRCTTAPSAPSATRPPRNWLSGGFYSCTDGRREHLPARRLRHPAGDRLGLQGLRYIYGARECDASRAMRSTSARR